MSEEIKGKIPVKITLVSEDGSDERWVLSQELFAEERHPLPVTNEVIVVGKLYKSDKTVYFNGSIKGSLALECSRCLKNFELPFDESVSSVFMPKTDFAEEGEEVELSGDDMDVQFYEGEEIDLFGPVRDQIALVAPMQPLCSEDCKGLCPKCGVDLNVENCGCQTMEIDPRLAALKKLIK